jgi:hypothetical protein
MKLRKKSWQPKKRDVIEQIFLGLGLNFKEAWRG